MVRPSEPECKTPPLPPLLVDEKELSTLWGCSKPTVRRIIARSGLRRVDLGCRRNLYRYDEVRDFTATLPSAS
jgi:hypothetical protein